MPRAGLETFIDGRPVRLLYRISENATEGQLWRVRPIFVTGPDRDQLIRPGTPLRPIHGAAA